MSAFKLLLLALFCFVSCKQTEHKPQETVTEIPSKPVAHNLKFENRLEDDYQLKGFQEVVFSVTDLEEATALYQEVAGWEIVFKGEVTKAQLAAWQVADSASAREIVMHNPGDDQGFLRLVKFNNVPQKQIRSSAQPWDTGGIFDVNTRVISMDESFSVFQANGWNAYSDPIKFNFANFEVEEVLVRGPDGIVVAMIERHAPPLEGFPNMKKLSHMFNSTQIVADIDKSYDFYTRGLGFKVYVEHRGPSSLEGPNVLSLPYNLTDDYERSIYIVHPQGINMGSIEIIQFHGVEGRNYAVDAVPPNLGILMLRFPVSNIEVFAKNLQEREIIIKQPITEIELKPYGKVKTLAVQAPGGSWLEFIELME